MCVTAHGIMFSQRYSKILITNDETDVKHAFLVMEIMRSSHEHRTECKVMKG
jgi:hypothetical protein